MARTWKVDPEEEDVVLDGEDFHKQVFSWSKDGKTLLFGGVPVDEWLAQHKVEEVVEEVRPAKKPRVSATTGKEKRHRMGREESSLWNDWTESDRKKK